MKLKAWLPSRLVKKLAVKCDVILENFKPGSR
jgi:crotonobetainyl-CoA:carnitine CoA-transferase CaiB-like acyl-CoA transferase